MALPHLFEFMDQAWLPGSLRTTLREILACGNERPFRTYHEWVAGEVSRCAVKEGCQTIVELGAGTAPITRLLVKDAALSSIRLIPCDANPDIEAYTDLETRYAGRVSPKYQQVDFSQPHEWPPKTLLFVSAAFHHVPPEDRTDVLNTLAQSADRVMILEPLRKTLLSMLFVFLSTVPAILLPLWFLRRPGRLRRLFWCWLFPAAPLTFWWDGLVSCVRQWTAQQWRAHLKHSSSTKREATISQSVFCQMVVW